MRQEPTFKYVVNNNRFEKPADTIGDPSIKFAIDNTEIYLGTHKKQKI